jgi:probable HAF family extracellular repeat protein
MFRTHRIATSLITLSLALSLFSVALPKSFAKAPPLILSPSPAPYTITDLGTLGGSYNYSYANAINNAGQVVGQSYDSSNRYRAFVYSGGSMSALANPSANYPQAEAYDINESGTVAGRSNYARTWNSYQSYFAGYGYCSYPVCYEYYGISPYSYSSDEARPTIFSGGSASSLTGMSYSQTYTAYGYYYYTPNWGYNWYYYQWTGSSVNVVNNNVISGTAQAINDSGDVVGYATVGSYNSGSYNHAFLYSNGTQTDLNGVLGNTNYSAAFGINNSGQITGEANIAGSTHPFLYDGGVMQDLGTLGGAYGSARAINEAAQVAGTSYTSGNQSEHAFLYDSVNGMQDLGTLGGTYSYANDLNAGAKVVGTAYTVGNQQQHAFVYDSINGMQDLNSMIPAGSGWTTLYEATGINDSGQIVGYGVHNGNNHAFLLTPANNSAPTAVADSFNTDEDVALTTTISNGVLANDDDAENNPLTASLVSGPSNSASFTFNPDGTFSYAPAADYHGPDSFTYKANDGTLDSEMVTVTIDVISVNDLPTAEAGAAQVIECGGASTSVSLNSAGSGDVDGDMLTYDWSEGATHLADGASPSVSLARGLHNLTLTVTDPSNASATDTVVITVQDTIAPTVSAPANVSVNNDAGQCFASLDPGTASASDQCGEATVAGVRDDAHPLNAPYPKGTTTITWTATDGVGLSDTALQTVTVTDAEDPIVNPPSNVNVNTDAGSCSAVLNPGTATATDNCSGVTVAGVRDDAEPLAAPFPKGVTTITWTATDAVGRSAKGSQTVTVTDHENPVVSVPVNVNRSTDAGACNSAIDPGTATANDNCAGTTVAGVRSDGQPLNAIYPKGTTTITWTATDAAGNTDSKTQTVTVNDTENPVISCPTNIVRSTDAASCSAAAIITPAMFTDNCSGGAVSGVRNDGQPLIAVYPKGITTITWTATDSSGNSASCAQTVTINDNEKPVIVAPDIVVPTTIAGSCATTPVTYNGLSVVDNCPGVGYTVSIPSGSSFGFGVTPVLVTATDAAGNVQTKTFMVTVQKIATTSAVSVTPNAQQYSDTVTFEARLQPDACTNAGVAATSVSFFVGSQNMGTVPLVSVGGILVGTRNVPLLEPNPFGTLPTGQMAPGPHTVTAVFGGVNPNFIIGSPTTTLNITQEDARAYYTGACFASTSSATASSATLTLSATIKDISAVDVGDATAGDIRNSRVTFINRDTNTVIASNLPVGLVSAGDTTIGTATYNWNVNIGSVDSTSFTVGIIVTNYYTRNSSDDNSVVTVSKPLGTNFITGGGYLVLQNSSGLYGGGVGTKNNFGFNVKFNKNGTNLQGNINAIIRNGGRVYQIKGNAITSLSVSGDKAIYNGKANIQDITDPLNTIAVDGNGTLQIKLTDMGEPGKSDTISLTIWNKNGGLWFASNWDGTKTIEQLLGGGNLVVH